MRARALAVLLFVAAVAAAAAEPAPRTPMIPIAGGSYLIGAADGRASARPPHRVVLAPFLIDRTEVTNAQFAAFLNTLDVTARRDVPAGELRPADVTGPDADRLWGGETGNARAYIEMDDSDARIAIAGGRFVPEPGFADHPVAESTWPGAVAYCAWRGVRLPSEAEWEAAARGREGRTYPWGEAPPTPARAVYGRGRGETDPVGSHPAGATPDGVFDLAGNLAEWTSSLFERYPYDTADGRGDPQAPGERVTRGGDHVFDVAPERLTGHFRDGFSRNPGRGTGTSASVARGTRTSRRAAGPMSLPNSFWSSTLLHVVLLIAVVYAAIVLVAFFLQARLVYYPNLPSRAVTATPAAIGLAFEEVRFVTDDGVRLDGWFIPAVQPRGVLLFFHGNAGNISHRLNSLRIFYELGLSTLIFDYRGYGRSEGKPSEEGTYRDAEAAWRYLTTERGVAPHSLVYFGRSLGAAIAAQLASRRAPAALIVESGFTSVPDVGARTLPFLPVRWLSRFRYDTREYLGAIASPVLIVHSRQDEVIAFRHGRALFERANEPKRFLEIRGGHNEGFIESGRLYVNGLDRFLGEFLQPAPPAAN